jgi:hypothetical protein
LCVSLQFIPYLRKQVITYLPCIAIPLCQKTCY